MTSADTLLVLRAQQGDRAALDGLLQSVQRPLFGYIARLLARSGVGRRWAFRIASREAFRALGRSRNA